MAKHVLIVFAHPNRKSFNGTIMDAAIETLEAHGHTVTVSDLYAMNFDPVISNDDLKDIGNLLAKSETADDLRPPEGGSYHGNAADDILLEQTKLDAADLVIFQCPWYWMGFPAIMKGWVDRVLQGGYCVRLPSTIYDRARFKGKRAMLSITTGGFKATYSNKGVFGDIDIHLWPIQNGVLRFVGYDVIAPHIAYGMDSFDEAEEVLNSWKNRLATVFEEKPLKFFHIDDFVDEQELKTEVVSDVIAGPCGPTTGQHCGLPLPAGNQTKVPK